MYIKILLQSTVCQYSFIYTRVLPLFLVKCWWPFHPFCSRYKEAQAVVIHIIFWSIQLLLETKSM